MGTVYLAEHVLIKKDYALKILEPNQITAENWSRFQTEGKAIAKLDHQHTVKIFNMGIDDSGFPYYAMELIEGISLHELLLSDKKPNLDELTTIFSQIASALGYAHGKGIIHRDLKPSNIMLTNRPFSASKSGTKERQLPMAKLVDFGIAKLVGLDSQGKQRLTATGQIVGTPLYMSPEQCLGRTLDHRSDIYSFGCSLFMALCGRAPFVGNSATETLMMHLEAKPPTLEQTSGIAYGASLEALIAKLLAKKPEDRYQSMKLIELDLERVRQNRPVATEIHSIGFDKAQPRPAETTDNSQTLTESTPSRKSILVLALSIALIALATLFMFSSQKSNNKIEVKQSTPRNSDSLALNQPSEAVEEQPEPDNSTFAQPSLEALRKANLFLQSKEVIKSSTDKSGNKFIYCPSIRLGTFKWAKTEKLDGQLDLAEVGCEAIDQARVPGSRKIVLEICGQRDPLIWAKPELLDRLGGAKLSGLYANSAVQEENILPDEIIENLRSWKNLEYVALTSYRISKKSYQELGKHQELKQFISGRTAIDLSQLSGCSFFRNLEFLKVEYGFKTDVMLKAINDKCKLQKLQLNKCTPSPPAIALSRLKNCRTLTQLTLERCTISNEQLLAINDNSNIKSLKLWRCTELGEKNLPIFQRMRPDLQISLTVEEEIAPSYKKALTRLPNIAVKAFQEL